MNKLSYYLLMISVFATYQLNAQDCGVSTAQINLSANQVNARLQITGDLWWDGSEGKYQVPFIDPNIPSPTSLYAGGIWMGGLDPGGNLKIAASTYGRVSGRTDFYPGPLDQFTGSTDDATCQNWDRFFKVTQTEIEEHQRLSAQASYTSDMIPPAVKRWPARGNPFFEDIHGFSLPDQILADFWDENTDGIYNPLDGDYPALFQKGCDNPIIPTEMVFWIFNDAGGTHRETGGDNMQIEFQVTAFAFDTDNAFDYSTFYKYKIINRAVEDIHSAYFGIWTDPDLGCPTDDFIGCDSTRSLWYLYNEDEVDGDNGCSCPQGISTYCTSVPMLGMDIFRGPTDTDGNELEMSSFSYYNNGSSGGTPSQSDPQTALEYYNYLTGKWRDGSPQDFNGYAFPSAPDCTDPSCISMCTENLPQGDRRTVQSVGPMTMKPGDVQELILGVVWVPNVEYPCPNLSKLLAADDLIQTAFDNCLDDLSSVGNTKIQSQLDAILLSPNPFSQKSANELRIENLPRQSSIRIFDLSGKPVIDLGQAENDVVTWSPNTDLAEGIYFIEVRNEEFGKRVLKWICTK